MQRLNNQEFYIKSFNKYGQSAVGLNWANEEAQIIRFKQIQDFLPLDLSDISIIDAGCGFGDLYIYLTKRNNKIKKYIGYEIIDRFINIAMKNTGQMICHKNILKDEIKSCDYYVASGSLNILNHFETILFINRCFQNSKKGFIFNILESVENEQFNCLSKQKLKDIASNLGAKISFKSDYFRNDITVFLEKVE